MELNAPRNIFVTFGAGRSGWKDASRRITREAEKSGLFDFSFNLNEEWLETWDPEIYKVGLHLRETLPPRGFGYWTWKPSVLLWADLFFPNHQIVYVDAGSQFKDGDLTESQLDKDLRNSFTTGGLAWTLLGHPEKAWTKEDLFHHLQLPAELVSSDQVQSGFIALSPLWDRKSMITSWRKLALKESGYFFTDISRKENSEIFIEHRHDQSVFSCLWKLNCLPIVFDKTHPSESNDYPILAYRNNSGLKINSPIFVRKVVKLLLLIKDFVQKNK